MNMYGVIDFSLIDTMPGGFGPFAPPSWMAGRLPAIPASTLRWRQSARGQQIAVVGRILLRKIKGKPSEFSGGPNAVEAKEFALSVWSSKRK
jgi:hypothetical protein